MIYLIYFMGSGFRKQDRYLLHGCPRTFTSSIATYPEWPEVTTSKTTWEAERISVSIFGTQGKNIPWKNTPTFSVS